MLKFDIASQTNNPNDYQCVGKISEIRVSISGVIVEKSWADEEWARGGSAGVMPPGGWTGFGPELRKASGRIHWAGCETATEWMGYVEGALQSGERVTAEILAAR